MSAKASTKKAKHNASLFPIKKYNYDLKEPFQGELTVLVGVVSYNKVTVTVIHYLTAHASALTMAGDRKEGRTGEWFGAGKANTKVKICIAVACYLHFVVCFKRVHKHHLPGLPRHSHIK